ncbi:MAG: response regulator [Bacteroidales bacterium]|jgi:adenylate cyclase|nr:response regulator [Bacteroidales bacterium]
MSNKTILVIEDTHETIEIIRKVLTNNNYNVAISTDGESAIQKAEMDLPDLILLDIMMPGIDGYETCKRLKDNDITKDIPVIFTSALAEAFDKVKAFKLGAVDYIIKPINVEELLARINTHLTVRQLQHDLQEVNKKLEKTVSDRTQALATTSKIMHLNDQKYRFLFNNLLAGIVFTNVDDGSVLDCNNKAVAMFGYNNKEQCLANYNFQKNYVNPEQRNYFAEQIIKNGKLENFELNLFKNDNSKIWIEVSTYYNKENNWFESIFIDITDRKKSV